MAPEGPPVWIVGVASSVRAGNQERKAKVGGYRGFPNNGRMAKFPGGPKGIRMAF